MAELKPCPMCGGEPQYEYSAVPGFADMFWQTSNIRRTRDRGRIKCSRCGMTQPHAYCNIAYAEKVWNRRPAEDRIREEYNATIRRILKNIADTQLAESPTDADHEDPIIRLVKEGVHDGLQHAYDIITEMTGVFPGEKR